MASFFEHQDRAQRRTGWLVALFLFGVFGVVAAVALLAAMVAPNSVPAAIGLSVLVIAIPFLYKLFTISSSGALVAQSLGGIQIDPGTGDPNERKILNVVEEMAIASGMPVPPVYVLDEECINAFAAGKTPQDAVIGVSRGAIESLTRDELQGVIAHEFSHIFHGDMRINMRAIAAIFGILAVGYIGYFLLRSMMYAPRGRRSDQKGAAAIGLLGLGLIVIGCIGTFFGRLMQAAISRQREFLADASAVQYTRNPAGIGNALRKIGAQSSAVMRHAEASQFNHMFFAEGVRTLFASHPPIAERVRRIEEVAGGILPASGLVPPSAQAPTSPSASSAMNAVSSFSAVGSIPNDNLVRAHEDSRLLDGALRDAVHDPQESKVVVLCVCLSSDASTLRSQRTLIASRLPELDLLVGGFLQQVGNLDTRQRLALVDVACATLVRDQSRDYQLFRQLLSDVVRIDGSISLFEWVVMQILRMRVEVPMSARGGRPAIARSASLSKLTNHAQRTLAILALQGSSDEATAEKAFICFSY